MVMATVVMDQRSLMWQRQVMPTRDKNWLPSMTFMLVKIYLLRQKDVLMKTIIKEKKKYSMARTLSWIIVIARQSERGGRKRELKRGEKRKSIDDGRRSEREKNRVVVLMVGRMRARGGDDHGLDPIPNE